LTSGAGGAGGTGVTVGGDGAPGGGFILSAGAGGARGSGATSGAAGSGGSFTFTAGNGGVGNGIVVGGTGGSFTFNLGGGGTSSGLPGSDGGFAVKAGGKGTAPQLFSLQRNDGALFFFVDGAGRTFFSSSTPMVGIGTTTPDVRSIVTIGATTTASTLLTLKLQTGATGDSFRITTSASSSIFTIDASGGFAAAASSSIAGTFQVSGGSLATFSGGFISQASSTAASNLVVAGVLQASSTLLATGLSTFYSGFVGVASSSVASTFYVGDLGTFAQGFLARASSTASAAFNVSGILSASSTAFVTATTTLFQDLVFDRSNVNRSQFVVVPTFGSSEGTLHFATTTVGVAGQYPLVTITSTTTGKLDFARVNVGTSTQTFAGNLDQFFVAGRINSSWPYYRTDFLGNRAAATADAGSFWDNLKFDEDLACTAGSGGTVTGDIYLSTDNAQNAEGCHIDMGDNNQFDVTHNPVLEVGYYNDGAAANLTQWVGFSNLAGNATTGTSTDHIGFYSHNGSNWYTVTRSASTDTGSFILTGVAYKDTVFQKLRIEASSDVVKFYIDGKHVGTHTTNIPTAVIEPDIRFENNAQANNIGHIDYIRVWIDDPPEAIASSPEQISQSAHRDFDTYASAVTGEYVTEEELGTLPPGTLMSYAFGSSTPRSRIAAKSATVLSDSALLGVVTDAESSAWNSGRGDVTVAIGGRALVRVSNTEGQIRSGDYLTSSDMSGIAVKAIGSGMVLGRALENFDGADGETILAEINPHEVTATTLEDEPQSFPDAVLAALADIGSQVTGTAGKFIRTTFEKIVAKVAVVGHLFTRDLTILPDGELHVPDGANQISGTAMIPQGVSTVVVQNVKVTATSKIFVTPSVATPYPLAVTAKDPGVGFTVSMNSAAPFDIPFDWFIVSAYPAGTGQSQVNIPPPPPAGGPPPPPALGPNAPANLVAVPAGAGFTVDLAWVDTSSDESGFKIERGSDGVNFSEIGSVASDVTSFNDAAVTVGELYHYRVGVWNASGISYASSVSITVPGDQGNPPPPPIGTEDTALLCSDGLDNDGDGSTDLQDADCAAFVAQPPPPPPSTEDTAPLCADTLDNDADTMIDLADPDCAAFVAPPPPPPATEDTASLCADTLDNDADTMIDLADSDCASFLPPLPPSTEDTASFCADGLDNDGDGAIDVDDPDCAPFVSPPPPPQP
ncbi:MAG: hypothetical protein AAB518_02620, partial [Patescibacteria group bacterium]